LTVITRQHCSVDAHSVAVFSPDERYRYSLKRVWDTSRPNALFVMLNPSTADEMKNDPTVERCERRARANGFGSFGVVNIFAWRATDPRELLRAEDPVGSENDRAILEKANWADQIIVSWGAHGEFQQRGTAVARLLLSTGNELYHLGLTKAQQPRHLLYVAYARQPIAWEPNDQFDESLYQAQSPN